MIDDRPGMSPRAVRNLSIMTVGFYAIIGAAVYWGFW